MLEPSRGCSEVGESGFVRNDTSYRFSWQRLCTSAAKRADMHSLCSTMQKASFVAHHQIRHCHAQMIICRSGLSETAKSHTPCFNDKYLLYKSPPNHELYLHGRILKSRCECMGVPHTSQKGSESLPVHLWCKCSACMLAIRLSMAGALRNARMEPPEKHALRLGCQITADLPPNSRCLNMQRLSKLFAPRCGVPHTYVSKERSQT